MFRIPSPAEAQTDYSDGSLTDEMLAQVGLFSRWQFHFPFGHPLFRWLYGPIYPSSPEQYDAAVDYQDAIDIARQTYPVNTKYELLARSIPALSTPTGSDPLITVPNVNMAAYKNTWMPSDVWRHSDIKNVNMTYVLPVFEHMMTNHGALLKSIE